MSTELLINLLQQLRSADAIDVSRNQDLDAIAKRLQSDSDFRLQLGQLKDVWTNIAVVLTRVVKDGLDPQQVEQLMYLFRIVRNGVAGVTRNQDQARLAKLPELIQEVISQAAHTHYGNTAYLMMLRAGVQALSNLLTGNNTSKDYIWNLLIVQPPSPSCDQALLSTLAAIEDETTVLSTVILCYNCIFESNERSALLFSTSAGQLLLAQLLNESHAASGEDERKSFEMIYTFFSHLIGRGYLPDLFEILTNRGNLKADDADYRIRYHGEDFYKQAVEESIPKIQELNIDEPEESSTASNEDTKTKKENSRPSYLSAEHVILFKMVDSQIYTHYQQQQQEHRRRQQQQRDDQNDAEEEEEEEEETEAPISLASVTFLTEVFSRTSALTMEILKTLDREGTGEHDVEDLANLSAGLMLLLGCFAHLTLFEDSMIDVEEDNVRGEDGAQEAENDLHKESRRLQLWFKAQHMAIVQGGLVENAIELLRQADKSLARVTKPTTTAAANTGSTTADQSIGANTQSTLLSNTSTIQGQQAFFVGLKRDIVKLVGNLAYRSRHVQDRIRECNGLIVMLSQCNIDDANPYLREYAILAMKNILAGNAENQALIEELQPIEAVDHPALQEARITARLDAATGRPVLSTSKSEAK
ncbi:hypothetical protein BGZ99_001251 [Dissophora globulifera]|uniref:Ataxin-10 homolog n=1 Tax=Dissophora globulifera TaxID=979702 RepID=A0A9P6RP07_9FUNG|nr:hypothetical protein BGZ99_001251 [Dissophora globulifera]